MFIAAQFTLAKTWKQLKCPLTDEWIKKMWYIYTMEYYSAIKKNEIMPFAATWIQLEFIILSEVNQKEKDKYHMISLICGTQGTSYLQPLNFSKSCPFYRKGALPPAFTSSSPF